MAETEIKCVQCGTKTREVEDITFMATVEGREVVVTRLTGTRCPTCSEEYLGAESINKVEEIVKRFRKPTVIFKRKITTSGGRRVLGIPEEIDRALGKKENADIWLEGDKIVAEVY